MKKRFFYIVLIIIGGLIFLVHRCPKPAPAEKAAEYVTKLKTVDVPDSLKNIFEIEQLVESQRHMQETAKDYLHFCKEYGIHTTGQKQHDNRFVSEKWLLIQNNGVCLARIVLLLRLFKQNEIDYDYVYGILGKDKAKELAENGDITTAINIVGKELDDLHYPERYQKYFELYAYFFDASNNKIANIIANHGKNIGNNNHK